MDFSRIDPLSSVPPSRHPFQIWVLAACALSGFSTVFNLGSPKTLDDLLPAFWVTIWGITLMIGGTAGLVAAWLPDAITGRLLERLALAGIGGMAVVYAGVILQQVGYRIGATTVILLLSVSAASVWRIRQLNREIRLLGIWARRKMENEAEDRKKEE